jgi:hypothetical protein
MPQTRDRIRGRDRDLQFNITYPGDWHLVPQVVIGDEAHVVVWCDRRIGDEASDDAQAFLELDGERARPPAPSTSSGHHVLPHRRHSGFDARPRARADDTLRGINAHPASGSRQKR